MNWIFVLRFLPRNALSLAFGWLARLQLPLFSSLFRDWFVRQFHIDMSDAARPQKAYRTVADLFIRELLPDARPLDSADLLSPVDGVLSQTGSLDDPSLRMIQAKGKFYTLSGLLRNDGDEQDLAESFRGGAYAVIYLAPWNYHRIHSPVTGKIECLLYQPGTLWPVNSSSVQQVDELFCVNERLTTIIQCEKGGRCALVKVGATNVGRITTELPVDWVTNSSQVPSRRLPLSRWTPSENLVWQKGQHLATFELGSTVVIVVDREFLQRYPGLFTQHKDQSVRVGQSLL